MDTKKAQNINVHSYLSVGFMSEKVVEFLRCVPQYLNVEKQYDIPRDSLKEAHDFINHFIKQEKKAKRSEGKVKDHFVKNLIENTISSLNKDGILQKETSGNILEKIDNFLEDIEKNDNLENISTQSLDLTRIFFEGLLKTSLRSIPRQIDMGGYGIRIIPAK